MTDNLVVGHYDDIDGLFSHVISERNNRRNGSYTIHLDIDYRDMLAPLDHILNSWKRIGRISFVDFGYNPTWDSDGFMGRIKDLHDLNFHLEIYDHHKWPNDFEIKPYLKIFELPKEGETKCTSEVITEVLLGPTDPVSSLLAKIANNSDFKHESPYQELNNYTRALENVIAAVDHGVVDLTPQNLIEQFVHITDAQSPTSYSLQQSKDFWPFNFFEIQDQYHTEIATAQEELETESFDYGILNGTTLTIGHGAQILHMKKGVNHLASAFPGRDIYACIHPDRSIIFHRVNDEVNLAPLGKAFNGGGREAGSGGFIPEEIRDEDITNYAFSTIKETLNV